MTHYLLSVLDLAPRHPPLSLNTSVAVAVRYMGHALDKPTYEMHLVRKNAGSLTVPG